MEGSWNSSVNRVAGMEKTTPSNVSTFKMAGILEHVGHQIGGNG
jgi:hypothetical protein